MNIRFAAVSRFFSYSTGVVLQIATIILLSLKLELVQFGLWGIAVSSVFVLSVILQLSYSQNIEKYFPKYNDQEKKFLLIKYIKTVLFLTPFVCIFTSLIALTDYFSKFEADNILYVLIMISFWSILESLLSIFDTYYISIKKSYFYDFSDLVIYKLLRFIIFYILLNLNYSVYYLIFASIILRSLLFLFLVRDQYKGFLELKSYYLRNPIFKNNFINLKYNITEYINNTIYLSFINILFIASSYFMEAIDIAHYSYVIIILNNLRPVMNSLPSILTPLISKPELPLKEEEKFISKFEKLNQISLALVIVSSLLIVENEYLITILFQNYFDGIYKLIFLSIFAASIRSIYLARYQKILFNDNENKLLKFNIVNSTITLSVLTVLNNFYEVNFVYIYILYELLNFIYIYKFNNSSKVFLKQIIYFSKSYMFVIFVTFLYFLNIYAVESLLLLPIMIYLDIKREKRLTT